MRSRFPRAAVIGLAAVATGVTFAASGAVGATTDEEPVSAFEASALPAPLGVQGGSLNVVVGLVDPPVAIAAKQRGLTPAQQRQYEKELEAKQAVVSNQAASIAGAQDLARVTTALNAVVVRVDSSKLDELEALPGIQSVRPIADYSLDLSETVPYIGAAAAHAAGVDGTGIRVAVIDSGIDYTHASFGGAGTLAAYTAAYGTSTTDPANTVLDSQFPNDKVIGGFDFVGEAWPSGPLAPDPDPIDCGDAVIAPPCAGGHGTHVADIIAGVAVSTGGSIVGKGVAPGAKLYMYKGCSAVSNQCSGVALLQAVDAALDPDGNGDISDRVDVINLSLGSDYGQIEDDLTLALINATRAGSVVVASAGNGADKPYIVGSPSTGPEIISVAQTQVPSAKLYLIDPAAEGFRSVGGSHQPWSAAPSLVTGTLEYNTGSLAEKRGCNADGSSPYAAGEHTGDILFVDRGACNVSLKATNAAGAGAIAVVIGNHTLQAPGDLPPDFSFGGGDQPIAAYTITLRDANHLRGLPETTTCPGLVCPDPASPNAFGQSATIDPATAEPLVGNMSPGSSRGPSYSFNAIKPDIGAPGASFSAEAGTGVGGTAFGGTSGAAPMVSGSAALLLDKNSSLSVGEVKALLMNTAETNIGLNPVGLPGVLAPITRIGGGEVRVDRALASGTAAWDANGPAASLSFAYRGISETVRLRERVAVKNYGDSTKTYSIEPSFRYASDAALGAVTVNTPSSIRVGAGQTRRFDVTVEIDPSKLLVWDLNGGSRGGDGFRLTNLEFDGYITINGGENDTVHLAWQVLPHRSADVRAQRNEVDLDSSGTGSVVLENRSSVLDGRVDVFSLTGRSDRIRKRFLPRPGDNFAVVDLRAVGVRQVGTNIQFGVDTFGARAHPNYPAEFDIYIDSNNDGTADYVVFNLENGGFGATGQNVVAVFNLATGAFSVLAFTDADLNSGNAILGVPMAAVGLTESSKFTFSVFVFDNYFTGALTDAIENMTYTLGTPKFTGTGLPAAIPAGGSATLNIASVPDGAAASPSQIGFLLMYRDAKQAGRNDPGRREADIVRVEP